MNASPRAPRRADSPKRCFAFSRGAGTRRRFRRAAVVVLALAVSLGGVFGVLSLTGDHQSQAALTSSRYKISAKNNFKISQAYGFSPKWNGSGTSVTTQSGWTAGNLTACLNNGSTAAWTITGPNWAKNKNAWVKFTNVGWYNGKSVDLTITVYAFGDTTTASNKVARVSKFFNKNRTALESTGDVRWKFSYTYNGTSTAVSGLKSNLYFFCMTYKKGAAQEKVDPAMGSKGTDPLQAVAYGKNLTERVYDTYHAEYYVKTATTTDVAEAWTNSVIALYSGASYTFTTATDTLLEMGNGDTVTLNRSFYFTKTNESGAALAGATFQLKQGTNVVGTATSDANGLVNFGILGAGTYTLTETSAASGYARLAGSWTVTVTASADTVVPPTWSASVSTASGSVNFSGTGVGSYKLANYPTVPFSFTKTDSAGGALAGAAFTLKNGETTVGTATSGTDGKVDFGNLEAGTYTLTENSAPGGYAASGGPWTVTVTSTSSGKNVVVTPAGGDAGFNGSYTEGFKLANTPKTAPFSFTKVDAESAATVLAGAIFNLKGVSGVAEAVAVDKNATSAAAGLVDFGQLYHGSYTLTETAAPRGYVKAENTWTVAVDADAGVVTVTPDGDGAADFDGEYASGYKLANEKSPTVSFSFTKTGEDASTALAGATFALYACADLAHTSAADHSWTASNDAGCCWDVDAPLATVTTQADGKADFGELETGQYMLVETAAPAGYRLPHGQWLVAADSATQTVEIVAHAQKDASGSVVGDLPPAFKKDAATGAYSVANYKEWVMPLAGGTGTIAFTAAGAALVAAAFAWALLFRRRGKAC